MDIVLVGCGNIGYAMLRGWVKIPNYRICVVEPVEALRERSKELGVPAYRNSAELPVDRRFDVAVIATKPQDVRGAVATFAPLLSSGAMLISVAAGVRIGTMERYANFPLALIRCMPNMPAAIGEGMIVGCTNGAISSEQRAAAFDLLSAIGRVSFVDSEDLMDAVTGLSGSGPAYVFLFIEALARSGISAGLSSEFATVLATQTVYGAARLALEGRTSPTVLRQQVTSPNGTTQAALDVLMRENGGLFQLLHEAVSAAQKRSIEISQR